MSNDGKIRVPVTDKNGKATHVWKTQEELRGEAARSSINSPAPKPSSIVRGVTPSEDSNDSFSPTGVESNPFEGSSEWKQAINLRDLFGDEYSVSERAELIADRLTDSDWYSDSAEASAGGAFELNDALEELREAGESGDSAHFDKAWSDVYNIADNDKIWLETPSK